MGKPRGDTDAVRHIEVVQRFGRFSRRNEILGRETTTPEEAELLMRPGSPFWRDARELPVT